MNSLVSTICLLAVGLLCTAQFEWTEATIVTVYGKAAGVPTLGLSRTDTIENLGSKTLEDLKPSLFLRSVPSALRQSPRGNTEARYVASCPPTGECNVDIVLDFENDDDTILYPLTIENYKDVSLRSGLPRIDWDNLVNVAFFFPMQQYDPLRQKFFQGRYKQRKQKEFIYLLSAAMKSPRSV